jgi:hypothetical protein
MGRENDRSMTPAPRGANPKSQDGRILDLGELIHGYWNWVLRTNTVRITVGVMNTISLKLPDRLLELLEAESRARRTTKSSLIRECLEMTLAAPPAGGKATCYDLARDLAGSVKGLPRDLATNPKYLEGFGR